MSRERRIHRGGQEGMTEEVQEEPEEYVISETTMECRTLKRKS